MPTTRAVVFDAYGTLFDVRSLEHACAGLVPDPAHFTTLWRAKQLEYTFQRALTRRYVGFGEVTRDALRYAAAATRAALSAEQIATLMDAWHHLTPFADTEPMLRALTERGVTLAILSNGEPEMLARMVTAAGLDAYFARLLSVDAVRTFKPDPSVYTLAERELKRERSEILFVSANYWDAVGARSFGLRACWINRSGGPADELGLEPDHVRASLTQLSELVGT